MFRTVGNALLVAALLAALAMLWSPSIPSSGLVLCLLLFPPALGTSLLCRHFLLPLAGRWRLRTLAQGSVTGAGMALALLLGLALSNQLLVGSILSGARAAGYGAAGALAVALGLLSQPHLGPWLSSLSPRRLHHLLSLVILSLGLLVGILDQTVWPRGYFSLHGLLLVVALVLLMAGAWLWRGPMGSGALILTSLLLSLLVGAAWDNGPIEVDRLVRDSQASQRWLLELLTKFDKVPNPA